MYFCRATINLSLRNYNEAKKDFEKAKEVFQYYKEMQDAIAEIDK